MKNIPATIPDAETIKKFNEFCLPVFEQQRILEAQADLRAGERQTFLTDMLLIGDLLERLRAEERLRLSNILSIC